MDYVFVLTTVISGDILLNILMDAHPGEIKAQIVEENGTSPYLIEENEHENAPV